MNIRELLKKNRLLTKKIINVDYHMDLLNYDVENFKYKIPQLRGMTEAEVVNYSIDVYSKCDLNNPEYDSKIDEETTRIALRTNVFYGGHNHNKWETGTFEDDYYGFGNDLMATYDRSLSKVKIKKRV